ncbi:MAG: tetratricopeptide repeat protein, partial [Myxococcaceae bacterium]
LIICLALLSLSCSGPRPLNPRALVQENACIQSLEIEDYTGAKVRCELCLEYDDSVAACMNGLGLVAYAHGDNGKAVSYFTKAIKQSKNFAQARNNLGAIYFKQANFQDAIPYFQAALQIDPGYEDARYNLGLSFLRIGQKAGTKGDHNIALYNYTLAKKQYLKLIAVNASYVNGYRDLGLIMTYEASMQKLEASREADLQAATTYFQSCLQVNPTNETCHESYGQTLLYQKQYDAALQQFVECLAVNKKNSTCIAGTDSAYQGSQLKSESLKTYVGLLKKNPNDAQAHYGYCALLFNNGMNDLAVSECQKAVSLNNKICPAYYSLGMYYKKVLNSAQALSNCQSFALCPGVNKDPEQSRQCNRVITALSGS